MVCFCKMAVAEMSIMVFFLDGGKAGADLGICSKVGALLNSENKFIL